MRIGSAPLILLCCASAPAVEAHPHIYIDGGVDFRFDAGGRLTELGITWIYDQMTSLLMLVDLALDPARPLEPADRARLAAYQTEWQPGFDGDSYLRDGDRELVLSGPLRPEARIEGGQVVISFARAVAAPFRPSAATVVEVYDPTYYTAYTVTDAPHLEGGAGCTARVENFHPTAELQPLLDRLAAIPADADPEEAAGRLLADKVRIACD